MAKKYSERIENMDDAARGELDARIREYHEANNWQATLAKYKPSPIQLRAILAGKDASKAKAKKRKPKSDVEAEAAPEKVKKAPKKAKVAKVAKKAKKAKKAPKKKASAKKAKAAKPAKGAAPKRKPGRPKGSGNKKKAAKKASKKNGVRRSSAMGDLVIEGKIDATQFVAMILSHSESMVKLAAR